MKTKPQSPLVNLTRVVSFLFLGLILLTLPQASGGRSQKASAAPSRSARPPQGYTHERRPLPMNGLELTMGHPGGAQIVKPHLYQAQSDNVALVGQIGGTTEAVAVQGNYAYVAVGLRLVVLDVSDPTTPEEIGSTTPFPQFVEGVAVSGTEAYVTVGTAGLRIVDISDPAHPVEVGVYDTPGYAEAVAVAGQYAYVADGHYGLRVVNTSDPAHPAEVAYAYPLNYVFDVVAYGQYAYLAAAGAGLLVVDISDPAQPVEMGTYDTPGYAYGVDVEENLVYVADGWEGLRVVNASDPTQPAEVGSYGTPGWSFGVDVVGGTAYVADAFGGLRVLDVSDPTRPAELGSYEVVRGHAGRVAVVGNTAYVADRNWGLRVVDVSDPSVPTQIGVYAPLGYAAAVAVSGNYAYVAAATYGLRVVDISDPAHPIEVGTYDTEGYAVGVAVAGNYAYVSISFFEPGAGLHVVDISDPAHPTVVGYCESVGMPRDIAVAGGMAYVANEWGLELIDVSSPINPTLVGNINLQGEEWAATSGVDISGTLAYVAGDGGLYFVDVSDPVSPTLISNYYVSEGYFDVAIAGPRAYVTGGGNCLKIIAVSDPLRPTQLGSYCGPSLPERVVVANSTAYVGFGSGGLHGIDVSDPLSPTLDFSHDTPGYAIAPAVSGSYIYLADAEGGLLILETDSAPSKTSRATWSGPVSVVGALDDTSPSHLPMHSFSRRTLPIHYDRTRTGGRSRHPSYLSVRLSASPDIQRIAGTCVVTSAVDSGPGTLRECMEKAVSGDTITFDPVAFPPGSPATIALQSNLPLIWQGNLTIDASDAGVILDGNGLANWSGFGISSDENVIKGLQILNFPYAGVNIGSGAKGNIIGGNRLQGNSLTGEGNVISGNGIVGVMISDTGTENNTVIGNLIGTDASGKSALANGDGVVIANGASFNTIGSLIPGKRNIISGNNTSGVGISSHIGSTAGNTIVGNFIGTDVSGTADLGNKWIGVTMELGAFSNTVKANLISGANYGGIVISDWGSSYNTVIGNLIGTDASGTQPLGNRWAGVAVGFGGAYFNRIGGTSPGDRNVISGNPAGISLQGTGNLILGNLIGTNISGTEAVSNGQGIFMTGSASHNFVGGTTPAEINVISGNGAAGISVGGAERTFILGNYVGTDATGTVALANRGSGIESGGTKDNVIQGNLVAGNDEAGISIGYGSSFDHLRANRIGVAADGTSPLPNGMNGVSISAASNTVGGPYPDDGNIIAFNIRDGIQVWTYAGNTILHNSIYSNSGSGIHLVDGANNLLTAPTITKVLPDSVSGMTCPGCIVDVFSDEEDEGRVYEGITIADASGTFAFSKGSYLTGPHITATATDSSGNTSELSAPSLLTCPDFADPPGIGVGDVQVVANLWRQNANWPYDCDGDGMITILDIMCVVRQLSESCQ